MKARWILPILGFASLIIFPMFFSGGKLADTSVQALFKVILVTLVVGPVLLLKSYLRKQKISKMESAIGKDGFTKLMWAASSSNATLLLDEIQNGADVNQQDLGGGTALMYAATHGAEECTKLLLQHGANIELRTKAGSSALDYAKHEGFKTIAKMISKKQASLAAEFER